MLSHNIEGVGFSEYNISKLWVGDSKILKQGNIN